MHRPRKWSRPNFKHMPTVYKTSLKLSSLHNGRDLCHRQKCYYILLSICDGNQNRHTGVVPHTELLICMGAYSRYDIPSKMFLTRDTVPALAWSKEKLRNTSVRAPGLWAETFNPGSTEFE